MSLSGQTNVVNSVLHVRHKPTDEHKCSQWRSTLCARVFHFSDKVQCACTLFVLTVRPRLSGISPSRNPAHIFTWCILFPLLLKATRLPRDATKQIPMDEKWFKHANEGHIRRFAISFNVSPVSWSAAINNVAVYYIKKLNFTGAKNNTPDGYR